MKNTALVLLMALCVAACSERAAEEPSAEEEVQMQPRTAVATLSPTEGNDANGTVTFTEVDGGVRVEARVDGLGEGKHGFHIHEKGDCSAPDGTSAGGHFNPNDTPHGAPDNPTGQRHVGDLGNLTTGADGTATYDRLDSVLAFEGTNNVVGKAVIVHAGEDDLTTQPTGNAGARLACGVIEMQGDM